eukprot:754939-Hanusia_phi.AAC.4
MRLRSKTRPDFFDIAASFGASPLIAHTIPDMFPRRCPRHTNPTPRYNTAMLPPEGSCEGGSVYPTIVVMRQRRGDKARAGWHQPARRGGLEDIERPCPGAAAHLPSPALAAPASPTVRSECPGPGHPRSRGSQVQRLAGRPATVT